MTLRRWIGAAAAAAQVSTVTITAYDVATTYSITIGSKTVSVVGQGGTAAATAAALQAALAAAATSGAYPEFAEITWTVNGAVITATAVTAGVPFKATSSKSGGAGTIGAFAQVTANSGPNDISIAANYSPAGLPVASDDLYIEGSTPDLLYNLDTLLGVVLNSLNVAANFTGNAGLPFYNGNYIEYRQRYLQVSATTVQIGYGPGNGSGRIRLDTGTYQTTFVLSNSATTGNEDGAEEVRWIGNHASNQIELIKGQLGIARLPGETATVATLMVGSAGSVSSDATVVGGPGLTLTTLNQSGGDVTLYAGLTTVEQTDGTLNLLGFGSGGSNVTTLTVDKGKCYYANPGTITTLNVGNEGTIDFTRDLRGKNVTTCNLYKGATLDDHFSTVTWGTGGITPIRCTLKDVTIDLGVNRKITVS